MWDSSVEGKARAERPHPNFTENVFGNWSLVAALSAAALYSYSYLVRAGHSFALGIGKLSPSGIKESYFIHGGMELVSIVWTLAIGSFVVYLFVAVLLILGPFTPKSVRDVFGGVCNVLQSKVRETYHGPAAIPLLLVAFAAVIVVHLVYSVPDGLYGARALPLRDRASIPEELQRVLWKDEDAPFLRSVLVSLTLSVIVSIGLLIIRRLRASTFRPLASLLVCGVLLSLSASTAFVSGALQTSDDFPVVRLDRQDERFGPDAVVWLLGSDEVDHAFLVVTDRSGRTRREICVVPRSDIKQISVVRYAHLYRSLFGTPEAK